LFTQESAHSISERQAGARTKNRQKLYYDKCDREHFINSKDNAIASKLHEEKRLWASPLVFIKSEIKHPVLVQDDPEFA
jgi:hypothetical protein